MTMTSCLELCKYRMCNLRGSCLSTEPHLLVQWRGWGGSSCKNHWRILRSLWGTDRSRRRWMTQKSHHLFPLPQRLWYELYSGSTLWSRPSCRKTLKVATSFLRISSPCHWKDFPLHLIYQSFTRASSLMPSIVKKILIIQEVIRPCPNMIQTVWTARKERSLWRGTSRKSPRMLY